MPEFFSSKLDPTEQSWRQQLELFVESHKPELATLAWGLAQHSEAEPGVLGVDFQPTPHLVFCSVAAIAELNRKVDNQIQEILGIIDANQPEEEVLILGLGTGKGFEFKLIQFKPEPTPPQCYEQSLINGEAHLQQIEQQLNQYLSQWS
ncbi:hypothetical protein [Trichocoleus sp. FACHB-262]|uniref:beta-carboxysome assembly chaperone CcmS n=1 Tax=Trichocoleus sp. FACHB-262 TaxID=2692869 RepID=UPI001684332B|nr:hypothetical protein [Trichocoleus sp. FACHB-262]MBD2124314.1 hypothetical protein [Trichocoleus sp. FACHB-262]